MGSFNVSCGVSRLTIGAGDPMVLIPLIPSKEAEGYSAEGGTFLVSNEGPRCLYTPFTLPIFGTYSDYGDLENVEENAHTKAIEQFFGCSINSFQEQICRSFDDNEEGKLPKTVGGMFVLREIYDQLSSTSVSEGGKMTTAFNEGYCSDYVLKRVGFVEGEENASRERYNRPFTHTEIPGLVLWSDGTWIDAEINGQKKNWGLYNLEDLAQFLVEYGLPVPVSFEQFKSVLHLDVEYDKQLSEIKASIEKRNRLVEQYRAAGLGDQAEQHADCLCRLESYNYMFRFGSRYSDVDYFKKLYQHLYDDADFKKLVVWFKNFEFSLYGVNAHYGPSWNGYQCGNDHASWHLLKTMKKILDARWKERNENDGDFQIPQW